MNCELKMSVTDFCGEGPREAFSCTFLGTVLTMGPSDGVACRQSGLRQGFVSLGIRTQVTGPKSGHSLKSSQIAQLGRVSNGL